MQHLQEYEREASPRGNIFEVQNTTTTAWRTREALEFSWRWLMK